MVFKPIERFFLGLAKSAGQALDDGIKHNEPARIPSGPDYWAQEHKSFHSKHVASAKRTAMTTMATKKTRSPSFQLSEHPTREAGQICHNERGLDNLVSSDQAIETVTAGRRRSIGMRPVSLQRAPSMTIKATYWTRKTASTTPNTELGPSASVGASGQSGCTSSTTLTAKSPSCCGQLARLLPALQKESVYVPLTRV